MVQSGSDAHQVDVNGAWKATFQIVMNLLMILIMREVSVLWPRVGSPIKKYQPWAAIPLQEVKRRRTVTQINIYVIFCIGLMVVLSGSGPGHH